MVVEIIGVGEIILPIVSGRLASIQDWYPRLCRNLCSSCCQDNAIQHGAVEKPDFVAEPSIGIIYLNCCACDTSAECPAQLLLWWHAVRRANVCERKLTLGATELFCIRPVSKSPATAAPFFKNTAKSHHLLDVDVPDLHEHRLRYKIAARPQLQAREQHRRVYFSVIKVLANRMHNPNVAPGWK